MSQRDEVYGFDFALPESYSGIVLHNPTGRHGRWNPRDMGYHLQNGELRLTTSSKTPYEYIGTWAHDQNHCDTCWQCKQICKICTPKEENVIINEADLQLRVQMEKRKLEEEVERKRQIVERLGDDIFDEGDVLAFTKQFTKDGMVYSYAAIKAGDSWYTTGPKGGKYTWDEFVLWLVSGDVPTTGLTQLFAPSDNTANVSLNSNDAFTQGFQE